MDGTSVISDNTDMEEEEDKMNYQCYQSVQQDTKSSVIKLEAETTNEHPGICQLLMDVISCLSS